MDKNGANTNSCGSNGNQYVEIVWTHSTHGGWPKHLATGRKTMMRMTWGKVGKGSGEG